MNKMWAVAAFAAMAACAERPVEGPVSTTSLGAGPAPESASQSAHGAAVAAGMGYHGPVDHTDKRVGD